MDKSANCPPLIEYHNVKISRGRRVVLDGINLAIALGENVAIIGPNGAGKSSLIKTINREFYPYASNNGSYLRILGKERWDVFELRSLLGIVAADLLFGSTRRLNCREVILSGFFSSIGIWPHQQITAAMERRVDEIMRLLKIAHLDGRNVAEISTGEQRRVLIGRALVHKPKALLLDEPSSSLDLGAAHQLRQILRSIAQSGTGIIVVTHNLTDIIPEIKRVILLKDGNIFADGVKDDVLTADALSRLFGGSFELRRRDGYYYLW